MRGFGECIVHRLFARGRIGGGAHPVDRDIAGDIAVHLRRAGLHRLARIGDRGQVIVLDRDQFGAVERRSSLSAMTATTGSPTCVTRSPASVGR